MYKTLYGIGIAKILSYFKTIYVVDKIPKIIHPKSQTTRVNIFP